MGLYGTKEEDDDDEDEEEDEDDGEKENKDEGVVGSRRNRRKAGCVIKSNCKLS